jgi:hypothetical protein
MKTTDLRNASRVSFLSMVAITITIPTALAQGDVFNAGSSANRCREARVAENRRHNDARAEIAKERLDSGNQFDRDRINCRGEQSCLQAALERHGDRERQLQIKNEDEITRHSKANVDIGSGRCSGRAPQEPSPVVQHAGLPFTENILKGLSDLLINKVLPDPKNPTPVNATLIGKLLFLKMTPAMNSWLVDQLNQVTISINILRGKASPTDADRAELSHLASYGNTLQKSIRELRLSYERTKNELGLEAASFPSSGEIGFAY